MFNQETIINTFNAAINTAFATKCELAKVPVEIAVNAVDLLQSQEPMTLIQAEKVESYHWEIVKIYCCGNCGLEFNHYSWKYCPYCGRKAKLDE